MSIELTPRSSYGGGGSGYVSHGILPSAPYMKLEAYAGGSAEDSYIKDLGDCSDFGFCATLLRGESGGDARNDDFDGAAGYSGGGGYSRCDGGAGSGGSGGSDGESSDPSCSYPGEGGEGSALNVSAIALQHFVLTPGKGGSGIFGSQAQYGGGGGGVLVDGGGPLGPCMYFGEGYGGGANVCDYDGGLPGVILLDFAPE